MPKPRTQLARLLVLGAVATSLALTPARVRTTDLLERTAEAINTTGYEDSPFLSPDGLAVYFMYTPWTIWPVFFGRPPALVGPERHGHHINPMRDPWEDTDIYVSTRQDGGWSTPRNLGFNDDQSDCCAMTWDGRLFAYQRTQRPATARTDLYFVEHRADGRWVRTSAGAAVNLDESSESNAHLSADGHALFFTSDRPGGEGKNDLWVSYREADGTWPAPRNLGIPFNTDESEDQIWVSRDGQTIVFSREPGPQILESRWLGAAGWSTPTRLLFDGRFVPGAEASLTDDGARILFAEVRPELEDIILVLADRKSDGSWGPAVPIPAR